MITQSHIECSHGFQLKDMYNTNESVIPRWPVVNRVPSQGHETEHNHHFLNIAKIAQKSQKNHNIKLVTWYVYDKAVKTQRLKRDKNHRSSLKRGLRHKKANKADKERTKNKRKIKKKTEPALQEVGGSFWRSLSSFKIRFEAMDEPQRSWRI